ISVAFINQAADGGQVAHPAVPAVVPDPQSTDSTLSTPAGPLPFQIGPDGEVISLRSEYSTVFQQPDGSLQQTIGGSPVNYLDAAGTWQKIDTTLVPSSTAGYMRNAAGGARFELPTSGGTAPIKVTTAAGVTTFSLEGAALAKASIGGSQATYASILSGIDATYAVTPLGLKEGLVLTNRPIQAPVFTFDVKTGSLVLKQE